MISGVGFAMAKMIASSAIVDTISAVTIFGAETPINTSLSLMISVNVPVCFSLFVISAISFCAGFIQSSPGHNAPFWSTKTTFPAPNCNNNLQIEIPADPAPLITMFASSIFFPTNFKAFNNPAATTMAVPC